VRQILKQPEPASLTTHRFADHADYANYAAKEELRAALVGEQLALCCYCMGRIRSDWRLMKIEHWRSQANHRADQLNYQNLLGACKGGDGQPFDLQHCDTRKGNADLQWNPADPAHHIETRLTYAPDGTIHAGDAVFDAQLNNVLNLNLPQIKNNRKGVLSALVYWWKGEKNRLHGPVPKDRIQREIEQRTTGAGGSLSPYCQVAVWWLQQRLAGMA
jgi:uncharacterized protein (TIGR02646 family)